METTLNIVSIIIIVFGILQIILFFKLWGMTNDVNRIKNMLDLKIRQESQKNGALHASPSINPIKIKQGWNSDITEEDKNRVQSIIPSLKKDEVIIKINKNNKKT